MISSTNKLCQIKTAKQIFCYPPISGVDNQSPREKAEVSDCSTLLWWNPGLVLWHVTHTWLLLRYYTIWLKTESWSRPGKTLKKKVTWSKTADDGCHIVWVRSITRLDMWTIATTHRLLIIINISCKKDRLDNNTIKEASGVEAL